MSKAKLLCRNFAECYPAFQALDAEGRAEVERLIQILHREDTSQRKREEVTTELARRLFPAGVCVPKSGRSFGERVDAIMRERGMNQRDLARVLRMHPSAVYVTLARRSRKPWRRTVKRVADALGMTTAELWPAELAD